MRYSQQSMDDVSMAGDIPAGTKLSETAKGAKFGRYSRVCRRTCNSRNGLNKIPENDVLDSKRFACFPQMELIPSPMARVAPPGTKAKTNEAPNAPKEENRKRRAGIWKVFKMKPGSEKRKTHNHQVDSGSMLSFV